MALYLHFTDGLYTASQLLSFHTHPEPYCAALSVSCSSGHGVGRNFTSKQALLPIVMKSFYRAALLTIDFGCQWRLGIGVVKNRDAHS